MHHMHTEDVVKDVDQLQHVIVGAGMTALHFAEALAARSAAPMIMIGEETFSPYDRVHLGGLLSGDPPERLTLRSEDWFREQGITLHLKNRADRIDRNERVLHTTSGMAIPYDRLIFATGGRAFLPPIPGSRSSRVVTYRTIEDAQKIARQAKQAKRVVVAGGGLLGLEAARAIQDHGCQVDIVEMAPRLLPRQLDREGSDVLERQILALGLHLRLLSRIEEIAEPGGLEAPLEVRLTDGNRLEADLVIFAAGIRPNDEVAREAGLACHRDGGIEVDDHMFTSDPQIFAIGECARHRGQLYGFVAPCYEMADVLADQLTGGSRLFEGATPSARLKVDEIDVAAVGESLAEGHTVRDLIWVQRDAYRRIVLRDGKIIGAIAVGSGSDFPQLQAAVASQANVRAWHEKRFALKGRLWREGGQVPANRWPDAAVVCTCTGVTCGQLRQLKNEGCRTSTALSEKSGAGTVCGNCQPILCELAGELNGQRRGGAGRSLGITALAGFGLLAVALAVGPIPYATTVLATPDIDFLWRDAWWKKASGFSLLALCVLSLGLSLRKRWPRISFGEFRHWRLLHSVLGVGTIAAAGVHSGLRLGNNLNFALMVCFLGVVILGSGTALVASLEHRLPPPYGSTLRRGWTLSHLLVFWPMPILVAFHVLAAYFY